MFCVFLFDNCLTKLRWLNNGNRVHIRLQVSSSSKEQERSCDAKTHTTLTAVGVWIRYLSARWSKWMQPRCSPEAQRRWAGGPIASQKLVAGSCLQDPKANHRATRRQLCPRGDGGPLFQAPGLELHLFFFRSFIGQPLFLPSIYYPFLSLSIRDLYSCNNVTLFCTEGLRCFRRYNC